jgi:hypothetical protein
MNDKLYSEGSNLSLEIEIDSAIKKRSRWKDKVRLNVLSDAWRENGCMDQPAAQTEQGIY